MPRITPSVLLLLAANCVGPVPILSTAAQAASAFDGSKAGEECEAELPERDDYPVGNVNFAEAEAFCRRLTELAHEANVLPKGVGVPLAHGSSVGIRLSRRNDHSYSVWRQTTPDFRAAPIPNCILPDDRRPAAKMV